MTLPHEIGPDQLKAAAVAVIVVLVLVLFLVMRFMQKMVLRVILAGVLIAAGAAIYAQRSDLDACQRAIRVTMAAPTPTPAVRCTCTVAGVNVRVPDCPFARPLGG